MVTLLQELYPNLLIHLFAKNDLYLSINMAQLLTFNPIICSNFSAALFCHRSSNELYYLSWKMQHPEIVNIF
jgi:hypothetical protein